jgi:hypothetical protein
MFKLRIGHLLSVALAPLAGLAIAPVAAIGVTSAVAQETSQAATSCFTDIDYSTLTFDELHALIEEAVGKLDPTMSPDDIAIEIGRQIGETADGCSAGQLQALAQNVAIILTDLGVEPTGNVQIAQLVAAGLAPSTAATVEDEVIPPLPQPYT